MKKLTLALALAAAMVGAATPASANWNWHPATEFCYLDVRPSPHWPMGMFRLPCFASSLF